MRKVLIFAFVLFSFFPCLAQYNSYEDVEGVVMQGSFTKGHGHEYAGYPFGKGDLSTFLLSILYIDYRKDHRFNVGAYLSGGFIDLEYDDDMQMVGIGLMIDSHPFRHKFRRFQPYYGLRVGYGSIDYTKNLNDGDGRGLELVFYSGFEFFIWRKVAFTMNFNANVNLAAKDFGTYFMHGISIY